MTVLLLLTACLSGCGKGGEEAEPSAEENIVSEEEGFLSEQGIQGSMVLEDQKAIYFCSSSQIRRFDKEEKKSGILWESGDISDYAYRYAEGNGLLLQDTIFFMERRRKEDSEEFGWALSAIRTDGEEYRRIDEMDEYNADSLYYTRGILYVAGYDFLRCYGIDEEDASVQGEMPAEEMPCREIQDQYGSVFYAHGGSRYLRAPESRERYGFYLMKAEDTPEVIRVDPESGERKSLVVDGTIRAMNQDSVLYSRSQEEGEKLCLTEVRSLKSREIGGFRKGMMILDMDQDFLYARREEKNDQGERICHYEKLSLENGEWSSLFSLNLSGKAGMGRGFSLPDAMNFTLLNGYAYYADVQEGKVFLMRRELADPGREETMGEAVYDSGISDVGRVESYYEEICSKVEPEMVIGEIAVDRIVVDASYPGAEEINRFFDQYQEDIIHYEKTESGLSYRDEEIRESIEAGEETYFIPYSYVSSPAGISYFDGKCFSFWQGESDYAGGAHDMPCARGFTFDLQTGKRLNLSDVTDNSEEELKRIVTGHFAELIGKDPDAYWSDALEVVEEATGYEADFYLTEEGICFFFGPYELACYAMGFQSVVIPYEEFEMKLF